MARKTIEELKAISRRVTATIDGKTQVVLCFSWKQDPKDSSRTISFEYIDGQKTKKAVACGKTKGGTTIYKSK